MDRRCPGKHGCGRGAAQRKKKGKSNCARKLDIELKRVKLRAKAAARAALARLGSTLRNAASMLLLLRLMMNGANVPIVIIGRG